ncbi:MAG: nucleotide exchange factor GrpE [Phycisphaeraceae bacterium]|nr:nucleotide exchange factor GrpE [Phycisphaeraceae bacterium]
MASRSEDNPRNEHVPGEIDLTGQTSPGMEEEAMASPTGESGVQQKLQVLEAEKAELQSKLLRTMADYQNYARRSEQNVAVAREQQLLEIARKLVDVLDHFDRALAVDPEKSTPQSILDGLRIVDQELLKLLEVYGVKKVEARPGDPFDPAVHEAMLRQPAEGIETDHVVAQFQPGYTLGSKVVRPAKVSVAP